MGLCIASTHYALKQNLFFHPARCNILWAMEKVVYKRAYYGNLTFGGTWTRLSGGRVGEINSRHLEYQKSTNLPYETFQ